MSPPHRRRESGSNLVAGDGANRASRGTPEARSTILKRSLIRKTNVIQADNWCPGAESNHRHGDFQTPEARRKERASFCGRPSSTSRDPSRQVRRSTLMHGRSMHSGDDFARPENENLSDALDGGPSLRANHRRQSARRQRQCCRPYTCVLQFLQLRISVTPQLEEAPIRP
jgi:hypothetical protein